MKNYNYLIIAILIFSSCSITKPVEKSIAYKNMYKENPKTILIMPPINKSTNVESKEYFHSTLCMPLADAGYYVIPPFLSMEILKKESAYDSELFLKSSLTKFGEIFGADAVLFTIIHKWNKSSLFASVTIEVEYILKSTKTDAVLYTRRGTVTYDASVHSNNSGGGLAALALKVAASAVKTAATDYVMVARKCNMYSLYDFPAGGYNPKYKLDNKEMAGEKVFKITVR